MFLHFHLNWGEIHIAHSQMYSKMKQTSNFIKIFIIFSQHLKKVWLTLLLYTENTILTKQSTFLLKVTAEEWDSE